MALAWFICGMKRVPGNMPGAGPGPSRYCAMHDFRTSILADGGKWAEVEILGDSALVKVRASAATLTAIAQSTGIDRIPTHWDLNATLGDLTPGQRDGILTRLLECGYAREEIDEALPSNWQTVTLRQVFRFACRRRLKPRYDEVTDTIITDGPVVQCTPIELVDGAV